LTKKLLSVITDHYGRSKKENSEEQAQHAAQPPLFDGGSLYRLPALQNDDPGAHSLPKLWLLQRPRSD